jgi:hypothetical protein
MSAALIVWPSITVTPLSSSESVPGTVVMMTLRMSLTSAPSTKPKSATVKT